METTHPTNHVTITELGPEVTVTSLFGSLVTAGQPVVIVSTDGTDLFIYDGQHYTEERLMRWEPEVHEWVVARIAEGL